jgi:hypothetical protein
MKCIIKDASGTVIEVPKDASKLADFWNNLPDTVTFTVDFGARKFGEGKTTLRQNYKMFTNFVELKKKVGSDVIGQLDHARDSDEKSSSFKSTKPRKQYSEAEKESLRAHQLEVLAQERLGISQEIRDELVANKCLGEGVAFDIIREILTGVSGAIEKLRANKGNPVKVQQTA